MKPRLCLPVATAAIVIGPGVFASCSAGRGPSDEALAYAATSSFILENRGHFFDGKMAHACLSPGDWPATEIAALLRGHHVPVHADCPTITRQDTAGFSIGVGLLRPLPIDWLSFMQDSDVPDTVRAGVVYSDARVQSATYVCVLMKRGDRWQPEECDIAEVAWRDTVEQGVADLTGCWQFAWTSSHGAPLDVLPRSAHFSVDQDTSWLSAKGRVMRPNGEWRAREWLNWGAAWRWDTVGSGLIELQAGIGGGGATARLVYDPRTSVMRGEAREWSDVIPPLITLEEDWLVTATRVECRDPVQLPTTESGLNR